MTFETREQVFERVAAMEKPICPHCKQKMSLWEVPPINFSDGLGWGEPFLFLCFNDECSMYVNGWDNIRDNYAHNASYRCINYPGTTNFECMPVFSPMGAKGQILDDDVLLQQEALKEATKRGFSMLADAYVAKDEEQAIRILFDGTEPASVRLKAAEMIGDIGTIDALEPIKNIKFGNQVIARMVEESVKKIHERTFTRECPFCAEIVKKRAKVCKHCDKDIAGK